jgi:hypothetical protein
MAILNAGSSSEKMQKTWEGKIASAVHRQAFFAAIKYTIFQFATSFYS